MVNINFVYHLVIAEKRFRVMAVCARAECLPRQVLVRGDIKYTYTWCLTLGRRFDVFVAHHVVGAALVKCHRVATARHLSHGAVDVQRCVFKFHSGLVGTYLLLSRAHDFLAAGRSRAVVALATRTTTGGGRGAEDVNIILLLLVTEEVLLGERHGQAATTRGTRSGRGALEEAGEGSGLRASGRRLVGLETSASLFTTENLLLRKGMLVGV